MLSFAACTKSPALLVGRPSSWLALVHKHRGLREGDLADNMLDELCFADDLYGSFPLRGKLGLSCFGRNRYGNFPTTWLK